MCRPLPKVLRLGGVTAVLDPGGYLAVVSDLVWSVDRNATVRDPARAFDMIPKLVGRLRAGLDLIGHPPAETSSFFAALERLHRPVLKLRATHRKQAFEIPSELPPADPPEAPREAPAWNSP